MRSGVPTFALIERVEVSTEGDAFLLKAEPIGDEEGHVAASRAEAMVLPGVRAWALAEELNTRFGVRERRRRLFFAPAGVTSSRERRAETLRARGEAVDEDWRTVAANCGVL